MTTSNIYFNSKLSSKGKDKCQKITIPISKNKLFAMSISDGYTYFSNQASTYDSEWGNFSGA